MRGDRQRAQRPQPVAMRRSGLQGREGRMTPSTFVARILGPVLVTIGIGLLLEGDTFRTMADEFLHRAALIYSSGVITLALGLAILNLHHLWVRDWRVLVTIFGWLFLIGGIFRLLAPSLVQRVGEPLIAHQRWPLAGAIVTAGARRVSHRDGLTRTFGAAASGGIRTARARKERGLSVAERQAPAAQGERGSLDPLIAPSDTHGCPRPGYRGLALKQREAVARIITRSSSPKGGSANHKVRLEYCQSEGSPRQGAESSPALRAKALAETL